MGADDLPGSIGALTGEAVLEGLARTNEYLLAILMGSPLPMLNRYIAIKHHGVYGVTTSLAEKLIGLTARSLDGRGEALRLGAQASVLPFCSAAARPCHCPSCCPLGDSSFSCRDGASSSWFPRRSTVPPPKRPCSTTSAGIPRRIAERILHREIAPPASALTRLYVENLQLAARIRLEHSEVLAYPALGDEGHRLQAVYNVFLDGYDRARPAASGRTRRWNIPTP